MLVTSGTLPHAQPRRANRFCEGGMFRSRLLALGVLVFMVIGLVPLSQRAAAVSTSIVISQVYGGGGNAGATFRNDFIELYNRGTAPVEAADRRRHRPGRRRSRLRVRRPRWPLPWRRCPRSRALAAPPTRP